MIGGKDDDEDPTELICDELCGARDDEAIEAIDDDEVEVVVLGQFLKK